MNEWIEPLMQCAEGMYVLEEESKKIVWVSPYFTQGLARSCVGEPCWKAFLQRETPCEICPQISEQEGVYAWDYFEPRDKRWMKVKHLVFRKDGVLYRAGNINMIDDVMQLNYETVQEIIMLKEDLNKKKGVMRSLNKEAHHDALTGLYNRNSFQTDLEQKYVNTTGLGVLYLDLNNLKQINDKYRHSAGDELICRVADVMRLVHKGVRNVKCYRIGGDEFVLLMHNGTKAKLTRCAQLFEDYMKHYNQNQPHQCSVAMGRAFSEEACDPEWLISQADDDMYHCKQQMKSEGARKTTDAR